MLNGGWQLDAAMQMMFSAPRNYCKKRPPNSKRWALPAMLNASGWQVTGVGWADEAIQLAKEAATSEGVEAKFIVADITTWEPPERYELVVSTYALPGGKDSERVLETAVRALAPGGTLIVLEWDKSMAKVWHFDEGDLMSPQEMAALLPGLVIEKAEVRQVKHAFGDGDDGLSEHSRQREQAIANVALVRARKPQSSK